MKYPLDIRKALPKDIDSIYQLVKHFSDKEIILERTREEISSSIDTFFISELNNTIVGVVSYHDYGRYLKEIRSLGVKKKYSGNGIGIALLKAIIDYILNKENTKIFALTYLPEFFKKNGFTIVPKNSLPEKIWKDCSICKNKDNCGETALIYSRE